MDIWQAFFSFLFFAERISCKLLFQAISVYAELISYCIKENSEDEMTKFRMKTEHAISSSN